LDQEVRAFPQERAPSADLSRALLIRLSPHTKSLECASVVL